MIEDLIKSSCVVINNAQKCGKKRNVFRLAFYHKKIEREENKNPQLGIFI
ncbi:hypothetical protein NTHiID24_00250 [Haemophilus influenzae]|nr:hypothetical protein CHBNIII5_11200 [Haemophilus influenzae]BBF09084.1 hypothetical protein CHBNIII8_11170 [Haemophilus influenzae]BBF10719.1 hypothetical protein CHBNIV1_10800 [Haemophilus influenzae]GBK75597.1 hypothetical protein NTHiID6_12130 [Haemophilus influenzae]GBK82513.1 hypothetical protein NTHiID12_11070 [Haemophilus influenzae]